MAAEKQEDNNSLQRWNKLRQQAYSHILIGPLQRETDRYITKSEPIYTGHRHTHPHIRDKEGIERG